MVKKGEKITIYSLDVYEKAIELKNKGYGSLKISKLLGIKNRGTVEYWINRDGKPYYHSEKLRNALYSKENITRLKSWVNISQPLAVKRAAELKTKKLLEKSSNLDNNLAYILGVIYGDGCISIKQRRVILSAIDKDFVLYFKKRLEEWSGYNVRFYSRNIKRPDYIKKRKLQWVAYLDSIEIAKFIASFDLNRLISSSNGIKGNFLSGFFDSEGSVSFDGDICCFNTNFELISFVGSLLNSLGINYSIRKRINVTPDKSKMVECYTLTLKKKDSIIFAEFVNFSIQRKRERLENYINTHYKLKQVISN